jgi:hypothetical protein
LAVLFLTLVGVDLDTVLPATTRGLGTDLPATPEGLGTVLPAET